MPHGAILYSAARIVAAGGRWVARRITRSTGVGLLGSGRIDPAGPVLLAHRPVLPPSSVLAAPCRFGLWPRTLAHFTHQLFRFPLLDLSTK